MCLTQYSFYMKTKKDRVMLSLISYSPLIKTWTSLTLTQWLWKSVMAMWPLLFTAAKCGPANWKSSVPRLPNLVRSFPDCWKTHTHDALLSTTIMCPLLSTQTPFGPVVQFYYWSLLAWSIHVQEWQHCVVKLFIYACVMNVLCLYFQSALWSIRHPSSLHKDSPSSLPWPRRVMYFPEGSNTDTHLFS